MHRLFGLLEDVENIERLPAERIGWCRSGVDRRQLRLFGAPLTHPLYRAIPDLPPPPSAAPTPPAATRRVVARRAIAGCADITRAIARCAGIGRGVRILRYTLDMLLKVCRVGAGVVTTKLSRLRASASSYL